MSAPLRHMLIRASAGTGKTHQLVHRYVALLLIQSLEGRARPDEIVAITFTRKGAAEFTQRILRALAEAAQDEGRRAELEATLRRVVDGDPAAGVPGLAPGLPVRCTADSIRATLAAMVEQNDRVVLSTIDSFMARSVQALAFELGIGGFEILEQGAQERQQDELLTRVFEGVAPADIEAFYQTIKQATLRSLVSLREAMSGVVDGYRDLLPAIPEAAGWGGKGFWGRGLAGPPLADWRERAAALAVSVREAGLGNGLVENGLVGALEWLGGRAPGTSASGIAGWLGRKGKLAPLAGAWPSEGWDCLPRSNARHTVRVPGAIMAPLGAILESWLAAEKRALSERAGAIHRFVSAYEAAYNAHARSQGRLAFSDLPWLLDPARAGGPAERTRQLLGFRWDQRFGHWLLDEFQDTSRVQWDVLHPWVDEAIQDNSGRRSVFVVGDAKQSIYGWRGGEPRLMEELVAGYRGAFQEQVITRSYRSPRAVIELVNAVCDPGRNDALRLDEALAPRLARWDFRTHEPDPRRPDDAGYAAAILVDEEPAAGEDEEPGEGEREAGAKLAARAAAVAGILAGTRAVERGLSCAILVRKGDNAREIAGWLRNHGVPGLIVEGDVTLADQVPVVAAIVDALRWLAHPAHTQAEGHARLTPIWPVLAGDETPGGAWSRWRRRVADVGAPKVTREWCALLSKAHPDPFIRYGLAQVDQLAGEVGARSLEDWVSSVERLTVREAAAPGVVQLMTIHKAKGLGFGIVILPDLDRGTRDRDEVLVRRDELGRPVACLPAPSSDILAWMPDLDEVSRAGRSDAALEGLCVLYVALTRSEEATFVVMAGKKPRNASAAREWLNGGVAGGGPGPGLPDSPWGPGRLLWESGSRSFMDKRGAGAVPAPEAPVPPMAPARIRRRLERPSSAGYAGGAATGAGSSAAALSFGVEVHRIFEGIEWLDETPVPSGQSEAEAEVRRCLEVPAIAALFRREGPRDEVLRELPFESSEGEEAGWAGVMDRVVLRRGEDGAVSKAIVADFKTDRIADPAELPVRYAVQIGIYRRALSAALGLPGDRIEAVLVSTRLGAVCRAD
jgi:ATP-dependent helicase/nuclease subunit A